MKILITGSQGYLGKNLVAYSKDLKYNVFGLDITEIKKKNYQKIDITRKKELEKTIKKIKPEVIIHLAALHNLKACQTEPKKSYAINCQSVKDIVYIIKKNKLNTKLIFLSSDYVFRGDQGHYTEADQPDPQTVYGQNKFEAEQAIIKNLKNYLIIRTAAIFGRGGNNFFNFIVDSLKYNHEIEVYNDTFFTPTYIDDLLKTIDIIIKYNHIGILHVAGNSIESRYTFAKKIAKYLGEDIQLIQPVKSPKDQIILTNSTLANSATQIKLGIKFLDTDSALKIYRKSREKN